MQKRRVHATGSTLPLTNADVNKGGNQRQSASRIGSRPRRRTQKRSTGCASSCCIMLALICGIMYLSIAIFSPEKKEHLHKYIKKQKRTLLEKGNTAMIAADQGDEESPLPLSEYESLEYAFDNSVLVGLYFAASWCPMSTKPTELLDEYFSDLILPPPDQNGTPAKRAPLSIVYVSSDETEEQMNNYMKTNWIPVPFESEERAGLKKEFSACAKREQQTLGIEDRQFEIPTLMIFDAATHGILTSDGVSELTEHGKDALSHWTNLLGLVEDLEEANLEAAQ